MIKNSSEYLDVKELVDFVLEYGKDNSLPNMEGSGEAAYQAALRLQQHGLPKAIELPKNPRLDLEAYRKDIIECAGGKYEEGKTIAETMGEDAHLELWDYDIEHCVHLIHNAYKGGLLDAIDKQHDGVTIEESLHTVYRREDLYDDDYGDCTRLHCGEFVIDLYYRSGNRELAETSVGVFKSETVLDDEELQYEQA